MHRRELLRRQGAGVATILLAGLAGCVGDDGDGVAGPEGDGADEEGDGDSDADAAGDDDAEDGPDDDIDNYDPVGIAEQYYEALDAADEGTLTELSHSAGVAIENVAHDADAWGDQEDIEVTGAEVIMEDLEYFYYPSAVVEISFDRIREDTSDLPWSHEVVLAVEDGELRVFDTNGDGDEIDTGAPDGPCPPTDDDEAAANLPRTSESFYRVDWGASFDHGRAYYRGPDGDRFIVTIEVHDTEDEAQEVDASGMFSRTRNGESWESAEILVARDGNVTCEIDVDNSAAADQMDHLLEQANCFDEEHVVDRSDA